MASLSSSEESSKKKLDSKTGSGERQTFRIYIYPTKSGSGAASTVTDKDCEERHLPNPTRVTVLDEYCNDWFPKTFCFESPNSG